jgi:hypothetical protein
MRPLNLLAGCAALLAVLPAFAEVHEFDVDVDGRAVGTHRFEVSRLPAGAVQVRSRALFAYRILGVTLYRYVHEADESWRAGCLTSLQSRTDDNGRQATVDATEDDGGLRIATAGTSRRETGCVRAFAYWDPPLLDAGQLLNPQTGALQVVRLEELAGDAIGTRRLRLSGDALRIDLWYGASGEWLQLESLTPEGKRLRYRRKAAAQ